MNVLKIVRKVFFIVINIVLGTLFWLIISENNYGFFKFIWLLIGLSFFVVLQITIHEAGHALCGKLTGYKIISFRVLSFAWSWQPDGRVVLKRYSVPGTWGQCVLAPPLYNEKSWPFLWVHLGGVLANLVLSGLALLFFDTTWLLLIFSSIGFEFAVLNGIPEGENDGRNILLGTQREEYRYLIYLGQKVEQLANRGMVLAEMPKKYFEKIPLGGQRTHLDDYHDLLRVEYFLDTKQWEKLRQELEMLWDHLKDVSPNYQLIIKANLLFYLLILQRDDPRIEEIWHDKELQEILKKKFMMGPRLKAAYLYYCEGNLSEALVALDNFDDSLKYSPTLGYLKRELKLKNWLRELMIEQDELSLETERVQNEQQNSDKGFC